MPLTTVEIEPVLRAMRTRILEHFAEEGTDMDTTEGRSTLDTNSTLAPRRADLLVHTFLARSGHRSIEGITVADLGCGFGSLAVVLAARGARVVAIDPNIARARVGEAVARDFGLDARFFPGTLQETNLEPSSVELAIVNNALCYIVGRAERRQAMRGVFDVLVPGGWVVLRNPSRAALRDPFTGLPLIHQVPPAVARRVLRVARRHRSDVRLTTPRGAQRELRRARFADVRYDGAGGPRRPIDRLAGYQHVSGRKPVYG